jgi:hypothetical protein
MSRRRPDHSAEMAERGDRRRVRSRRRKRRVVAGIVKVVFWALVLIGVFVLGIGYGRTIAGDDETAKDEVTVTQPRGRIEATLPTKTVTVTKTVAKGAKGVAKKTTTGATP